MVKNLSTPVVQDVVSFFTPVEWLIIIGVPVLLLVFVYVLRGLSTRW